MNLLKSHLAIHWHHHLAAFGTVIAILALTIGTAAAIITHGGFKPGPIAPPIRFTGSAPLPSSASLDAYITRIHNQGASNSCVGQGLSTIVEITNQERNHKTVAVVVRHPTKHRPPIAFNKTVPAHGPYRFSAGFIYDQANGGQDQGTTFQAAFNILLTQGDARLKQFPHDGPDWWVQPSPTTIAQAHPYRFQSWSSIAPGDRRTMEFELAHGRPFAIALPVHDTLYYHWGDPSPISYDVGSFHFWHVLTAIGYNPQGLRVLNSWGPSYGQNGQVTLTWPFIASSGAVIALAQPGTPRAPAPKTSPKPHKKHSTSPKLHRVLPGLHRNSNPQPRKPKSHTKGTPTPRKPPSSSAPPMNH